MAAKPYTARWRKGRHTTAALFNAEGQGAAEAHADALQLREACLAGAKRTEVRRLPCAIADEALNSINTFEE